MNFIKLFPNIPELHAVTTTVGFNACHYAGADLNQVAQNKQLLADEFGISVENIFIPRQTHSTNVATTSQSLENVDAVITNRRGQLIAVNTADCLPLLLADIDAGVIGAVHCGWRGAVAGIALNAVEMMTKFGAAPHRMIAAMGPCIGSECFEVGEEVASQFPAEVVIRSSDAVKPHIDLAKSVTLQLTHCGLQPQNIAQPIACSMCDQRFYSVRRQGSSLSHRTLTAILLP
jgi:hypothetical protein